MTVHTENEPSKMHGTTTKIGGSLKKAAGTLTGSTTKKGEGQIQKQVGRAEIVAAKAQKQAEGIQQQHIGQTEKIVGDARGNSMQQLEGNHNLRSGARKQENNAF